MKWKKLKLKIWGGSTSPNCSFVNDFTDKATMVKVPWNGTPKKVIALYAAMDYFLVLSIRAVRFKESGCLGVQPKVGGKFLLKLNTGERPIANKYREGKMQRTLKRELKVLEIVKREAVGGSTCLPSTHLSEFDFMVVNLSTPLWVPIYYQCWV